MQSVLEAALLLPGPERGELAARLMDAEDRDAAAELQKRIDDVQTGHVATIPWEVVRRKMVDKNNDAADCVPPTRGKRNRSRSFSVYPRGGGGLWA